MMTTVIVMTVEAVMTMVIVMMGTSVSNSCNTILFLLLLCNYVSFILHLFTSTYRLFVLIGLIFVIAGTGQNAGRR
jgi:hypothetical protein